MRGILVRRPTIRTGNPSASGLLRAVSRIHCGSQPIMGATSDGRSIGDVDAIASVMFIMAFSFSKKIVVVMGLVSLRVGVVCLARKEVIQMNNWTKDDYPDKFDELPQERQDALLDWIASNLVPIQGFNTWHTSYGLKHLVHLGDGKDSYYTNGEFKGAMLKMGYRVQNTSELNWVFNVSQRSPAFTRK